jgi:hypothetical protein
LPDNLCRAETAFGFQLSALMADCCQGPAVLANASELQG